LDSNHASLRVFTEEYHRPDFNEMLKVIWELIRKFGGGHIDKFYIDAANPFIKALKMQLGEDPDYDKDIARYKADGWDDIRASPLKVIPINFSTEHKKMLGHAKFLLEDGRIAINPKFTKLITALRTAVDIDGVLGKKATSYDDIFDVYRLFLQNVIYEGGGLQYYNGYGY
jgi:hypothetical protein